MCAVLLISQRGKNSRTTSARCGDRKINRTNCPQRLNYVHFYIFYLYTRSTYIYYSYVRYISILNVPIKYSLYVFVYKVYHDCSMLTQNDSKISACKRMNASRQFDIGAQLRRYERIRAVIKWVILVQQSRSAAGAMRSIFHNKRRFKRAIFSYIYI